MRTTSNPLIERLADIGGQLQKLRWEAVDAGMADMARDIAHAVEAVAWAAGIYSAGSNVIDRPGDVPYATPVATGSESVRPERITHAA